MSKCSFPEMTSQVNVGSPANRKVCGVSRFSVVRKRQWWMPWHKEPMKDAGRGDMLRGGANQPVIRRFPNGVTPPGQPGRHLSEYIGEFCGKLLN